jgi:hypothetical protein
VVACFLLGHRVTLLTRHRPGDDAILRRLQQRQLLCTSTSSCLFVSCGRRPSRTLPSSLGGDQRTSLACVKRPVGKIKNVTRTSRSPQTPAHVRSAPLRRASSISGCDKGPATIDSGGRGSCRNSLFRDVTCPEALTGSIPATCHSSPAPSLPHRLTPATD